MAERADAAPCGEPPSGGSREPILAIGEVVGESFEILELLGSGGMGQVFEAHDRTLNRRVAIKANWPDRHAPSLRKEAQALAAVRHPSMVTVHALGLHRGIEVLVMERVYGVRLLDHLRQRAVEGSRFGVGEALDVLLPLADGLAAVHRAGLAHRDVTPANVMLAPGNRVILMDFGVSLAEIEISGDTLVSGTPQYMAPETIRNQVAPGAAHLVDVYALGVIGFELLAGAVPFDGESVVEVLTHHLTSPAPDLLALRPDVPPRLAALLAECLAKAPADRPQSAENVTWTLRAIQQRQDARLRGGPAFAVAIVDDEPDVLAFLEAVARHAVPEAQVQTFARPEAALEAVHRRPPSVLLLDLEMTGMNGIEVAMYLRGTHVADRCTIALVSGRARADDVQLLQQLGVRHFLTKGPELGDNVLRMLREVRRTCAPP